MSEQTDGRKVQFLPPIKRYVNAIEWHLRLPLKEKARVMSDISTSIIARHESGESYEAIMKDMGTPRQVAERFNAAMGVSDKPSRWRFLFLVLLVLLVIGVIVKISYEQGTLAGVSLMQGIVPSQFFAGSSADVGVIGGADGPTAIFVTSAFPSLLGALLYAPASLACAIIACYFLARSPLCWRGALRLACAASALFFIRLAAELVVLGMVDAALLDLLASFGTSLLTPAFWLSVGSLIVAILRKKQEEKEL